MKKFRFVFLGLAILLCATVSACSGKTVPDESMSSTIDKLVPENITKVELSIAHAGVLESQMLTQTEIEELDTWVSQLSLTHRTFQHGEAPGDGYGQTAYIFSFNDDEKSFSWIDLGREHFILYGDEWYEIMNTSEPPLNLSE